MASVIRWDSERPSDQADGIAAPVRPVARRMARTVLQAALGLPGPVKLRSPTSVSFLHPNGFLKISLGTDDLGRRLYLHVWRDTGCDPNIHDHRWRFASTLLSGSLVNTIFELSPCAGDDPDGLFIARYTPQGQSFVLRDSGKPPVLAIPRDVTTLVPWNRYIQSEAKLHKVTAQAGTVTLVARGVPMGPSATVLTVERECNATPQVLRAIEPDERDAIIRSVLAGLA
jgi:hypothetical protein